MYFISVVLDPRLKMDYFKVSNRKPKLVHHARRALLWATEEYGTAAIQDDQNDVAFRLGFDFVRTANMLKRRRVQRANELERYLTAPPADGYVDLLAWWKDHAGEYPCLARIARDYLAIPATSDPAERAFSVGANLVSDKRGSLNEDTIQACMCLNSWM